MASKKGGLGRGLGSLFGDIDTPVATTESKATHKSPAPKKENNGNAAKENKFEEGVVYIALDDIKPNKKQPRKTFNEEALNELASSIKENGLIQPILVRPAKTGYELVAGERRWRASRKAGLKKIPAIIREINDKQNSLIALLENMQREDLNIIEEAEGIEKLMAEFDYTQEEAANAVGKSRPYVTNTLRLLKLPEEIKKLVAEGKLSAGHAKAILSLASEKLQLEAAAKAVKEGWSVRKIESYSGTHAKKKSMARSKKDASFAEMEEKLSVSLGTKVHINGSETKGKIEIDYFKREELDRILELLIAD